jgi:hypothetical protein
MVGPSQMSAESDAFIRQLGLRTTNDIINDMNRDFEEARAEKEARRREGTRQDSAAWRARAVEARRNMQQGLREQARPSPSSPVSCVLAEALETSK